MPDSSVIFSRFYNILNKIVLQLDLNVDEIVPTDQEKNGFSQSRQSKLALAVLRDALVVRRKKVGAYSLHFVPSNTLEIISCRYLFSFIP